MSFLLPNMLFYKELLIIKIHHSTNYTPAKSLDSLPEPDLTLPDPRALLLLLQAYPWEEGKC